MALVEVSGLKTYLQSAKGAVKAVDDVSFTIEKGETFCLVGESGSGKSIMALSIIQLLPHGISSHPSGNIQFDWRKDNGSHETVDMLSLDEEVLCNIRGSRIAMIFQEPMTSLNPVFTIGDQIMEAIELHHPERSETEVKQQAIDALNKVQIKDAERRFNDYPHQLSGGQRQRVMIAMALACEPDLLIADEPTTALDVTVQAEILELMRELQRNNGMSILFITHDFGVVAQMAHKVGVMQQGKLIEQGETREVLTNPQHPYSKKLLAAVPENLPPLKHARPDMQNPETIITVKDLDVHFPIRKGFFQRVVDHVRAVDNVSLDIPKGQIVALVGESGSGKTTLGRAILQLQKPTAGSVVMNGKELVGLSQKELRPWRKHMQIAFQDPQSSLNPRLFVSTTLTEPMKAHGIGSSDEERIELAADLMESVDLQRDHLWRYPHEFSGGQRQRIGLARAMALNPEFIVCDEITSALDVSVQAEVLELLTEIRSKRDLTLLFITHNIAVVEYLCDTTVVLKDGKIVEQGLTADVCGNPQQAYTQKLIAAVPRLNI
ncbi:MAG: ABC transporter ATP-binding protein [uncultured Thiotrichaceae bacterium]|uniref:ABC transporter ATP-binding protein n=1 Tax=uncultured Thiotrichaceae bacterium TaxID=298394 RepID=A0A6S6SBJ4_9GAMM|nr:MAG: ABC transporter ATP-binding protein [uncultured Thiotrichaceae bacterium]